MSCIFIILLIGSCMSCISAAREKFADNLAIPPHMNKVGTNYDQRAYSGIRPRSIVVIEHTGKHPFIEARDPYGWKKMCHADEVNPWHHPKYGSDGIISDKGCCTKYVEKGFTVYLLIDQHWPKGTREETDLSMYQCHPKVNQYYLYDFALLHLKKPLRRSKLAWIHVAEFYAFKKSMEDIVITSETAGTCELFQWTNHLEVEPKVPSPNDKVSTGSINWTNIYSARTRYVLELLEIKFSSWFNCRENYCPTTPWPDWVLGDYIYSRNERYCDNTQMPPKLCVTWDDNSPLCNITRGTPVFCDVNNYSRGLVGLMVDKNSICIDPSYGAMQPLTFAIDFIAPHIRLRHNPQYDKAIPTYIKNMRNITFVP